MRHQGIDFYYHLEECLIKHKVFQNLNIEMLEKTQKLLYNFKIIQNFPVNHALELVPLKKKRMVLRPMEFMFW